MGRCIVAGGKPDMVAPVGGLLLSSIAEGSIVKLNENGSPVEFYVAKHDYESGLNGTGRTLLVRKDCYDIRQWHSSNVNAWASCDLLYWLNSDYLNMFGVDIRELIGTTKYYYTPGNGNTSVTTRSDAVFKLSVTELGKTNSDSNVEGTALPIASILQIAYLNGSESIQWTRTPNTKYTLYACTVTSIGDVDNISSCEYKEGSRPAFTLPSNALFDTNTLILKGVS